jgi:uncharacterized protein (DUF433 family)
MMDSTLSLNRRERLIEFMLRLPENKLAKAEEVIRLIDDNKSTTSLDQPLDVLHPHIVSRSGILNGEPVVTGTRTTVRAIVENWRMGLTPAEIRVALPHLTLAQIFDALGYYSDHVDEINRHIERNRIPEELIDSIVKQKQ